MAWEDEILAQGLDTDGDGLSDLQELEESHTDPLNADTDGDQVLDGQEATLMGTSPLTDLDSWLEASRCATDTVVRVNPIGDSYWHWQDVEGTLVAKWGGGTVSYAMPVTTAGIHQVAITMHDWNTETPDNYAFQFEVYVDDMLAGTNSVVADHDFSGTGYLLSPWLVTGNHTITLKWLNPDWLYDPTLRCPTIRLETLALYGLGGPDANSNGIPDWMETRLAGAGDSDGDGLSDLAEVTVYHTSPTAKDSDGDGLSDGTEVQYGSNPNVADTDGDGMSDGEEVNVLGTDPLTVNFDGTVTDNLVNGSATNAALGAWMAQGTSIVAQARRGYVEYQITAPTADVYRVQVYAGHLWRWSNCNTALPVDTSDLQFYVDGRYLGKKTLVAPDTTVSHVEEFTPWLEPGVHTVRIFWENTHSRLSLKINSVSLQQLGGPDSDGNGVKDWVEASLHKDDTLDTLQPQSVVSPACIEGRGRYIDMMTVTAGVSAVTVKPGTFERWYADVPLSSNSATPVVASFQGGAMSCTGAVTWVPCNLVSATNQIVARQGDSVMFTAVRAGASSGTVSVAVSDGYACAVEVGVPVIHTFTNAGVYTVTGIHDDGVASTGQVTVTVVGGAFPTNSPACMIGSPRIWNCPSLSASASVEADSSVGLIRSGTQLTLGMSLILKDHYLVMRAGSPWPHH